MKKKLDSRWLAVPAFFLVLFGFGLLSSCTKEAYSEYERTQAIFIDRLGSEVSPAQWWRTAVTIKVCVTTESPVQMWLTSTAQGGTLYDYSVCTSSGTFELTAPQAEVKDFYLVTCCNSTYQTQKVTLTGKNEEVVYVNTTSGGSNSKLSGLAQLKDRVGGFFSLPSKDDSDEPDSVHPDLYGNSIVGGGSLYTFSDIERNEWANMMQVLSNESANARTEMGLNVNYELESRGPFNITWVAGNCLSTTPHVLGYYYHSPGTYSDIRYVDLAETEIFDVIDGHAKVQYQVTQAAIDAYPQDSLVLGKWYGANFDMSDRWGQTPNLIQRRGDNAWNVMGVFERYGSNICALRGLTFEVNVPAGMRVGFYDREEEVNRPDQYDRLVSLNVPTYTTRENFKGTSYSAEEMNTDYANGRFRSFIEPYTHTIWMGMENRVNGGDLDCNDVIFGITTILDIYRPHIVVPDLNPTFVITDKFSWTIAYEDVYREADFDFNDAVITLTPDYEKELCCVTVKAAGSNCKMYLHYDGPDGDVNLGEIHELLGGDANTKINTETTVAQNSFAELDCVPWPKVYSMTQDAKRFYIEVQRGTCTDCSDIISLAESPGQLPEAILIADGKWKWPKEGVHIFSAYNTFPSWAVDVSKTAYWNWYKSPKYGTYVSY